MVQRSTNTRSVASRRMGQLSLFWGSSLTVRFGPNGREEMVMQRAGGPLGTDQPALGVAVGELLVERGPVRWGG
jgi:hypothetical protein